MIADRAAPETVLITGASGGIGRALAELYARPGIALVLHGRDGARLEAVAAACRAKGAQVQTEMLDLRDVAVWMQRLGVLCAQRPVDLAIVNAGVSAQIGAGRGEEWSSIEEIIDVNLRAALATVHALLPSMRRKGRGQIALISSLSAYFGLPITPSYCASKAALKAYGESLRGWLAAEGIAVNVVLPGFVESAMSARFPGPKSFVMSPEQAARVIRRGLERNRARIAFPFPLNWGMWCLAALPPELSTWILRALGYGGARATVSGRRCR